MIKMKIVITVLAVFVLIIKAVCGEEVLQETTTATEFKFETSSTVNKSGEATKSTIEEGEESDAVDDVSDEWIMLSEKNQRELIRKNVELQRIIAERVETDPSLKLRPYSYGPPVKVYAFVEIQELLEISEVNMEMKLNLVMELRWTDPRLAFPDEEAAFPHHGLWLDDSVKDKLWIPRVSILNEKESASHSAGFEQDAVNWDDHGSMTLRNNIATNVACSMSLQDFPMDEQSCSILIGLPHYHDRQLSLKVLASLHPVFSSSVNNVGLVGYRVSPILQKDAILEFNRTIYAYELLLQRYVGYYIIGTYFPSALVVLISWLVFWMAGDAAGERMALGVTCVLTITTLFISTEASAPKVSYIKAIDVYMGVCFTLVFTTLLQSTTVGFLLRKVRNQEALRKAEEEGNHCEADQPPRMFASIVRRVISGGLEAHEKPKLVKFILGCDVWCTILYPLIFFIFNVVYWTYYSKASMFDEKTGWEHPGTYVDVIDQRYVQRQ